VGAATGVVAHAVAIEVTGDGSGRFRVLGAAGGQGFDSAGAALAFAERQAREQAAAAVLAMGAEAPEIRVVTEKRMLPDAVSENDLLHALVTAEAVGRPQLARARP
jgi:hypothetical protein